MSDHIVHTAEGNYEVTVYPTRDWADLDVKTPTDEMQPLRWENGKLRSRLIMSTLTKSSYCDFDLVGTQWQDVSDNLHQACITALEECALFEF